MKSVELKSYIDDYYAEEAYKILRTNIEFSGYDNQVIVLTSCQPNEGKSTTSLQLALALSDAGEKVLFIDADLRKSVMSGRFEIKGKVQGLSHFLAGKSEVSDVMYKVKGREMAVIFSGVVPPNPAEMLGKKRFAAMINGARKAFDYIIIDAPPIGSVIDAAIIAKVCDSSILVIQAGAIKKKFAQAVKSQMERSGCPLLGVVINKADKKTNSYYGERYGGYYKKEE